MADTQTYSHSEIQRYLQHKMSPQEMHEFEKALMNDAFLADALEGFSTSDRRLAEEHLATIERSLTNEKQEAKVVPLAIQRTVSWKVAAVVMAIISAGAITYAVINHHGTAAYENKVAATAPTTNKAEKDSIGPVDKPLAKVEVPPRYKPQQQNTFPLISSGSDRLHASAMQKRNIEEMSIPEDTAKENTSVTASAAPAISSDEVVSAKRMMLSNITSQNEFKGKVVDKSGEPLPYAAIKANNNVSVLADAKGNFTLKAPDSVLQVNVNSPGYVAAGAKIKSNDPENKITLKDSELSLADIVVTTMAKKKKNHAATVQIDSSIAAEPFGGWTNFKQYLNQQLDSLKANNNDFNEDIALEFSIDKQGHPIDIKAAGEIDKMMADNAIKILSNGPRWKNTKKDKKVKVIIAF